MGQNRIVHPSIYWYFSYGMNELIQDIIFLAIILFVIIVVLVTLNWYFNHPRYDSEDGKELSKMFTVEPNNASITKVPTLLSSASAAATTSSTDGDNVASIFKSKDKRS